MDTTYYEDGDPYAPEERKQRLIRPWVWGLLGLAAVGAMAYAWFPRHWQTVPVLDQKTNVNIPTPVWNGYQSVSTPAGRPAALERDPRVDELQRQLDAMRQAEAEQNKLLQQLLQRKDPAPQTAPAQGQATKPVKRGHRDMGYMEFELPKDASKEEPLYVLAPADTKVPCIVETKMNSDVESNATVKLTTNIYDTKTRRRLLVPQGSTLLLRYYSKNLIYGNQRLPITSTLLTLPNGKTLELEQEPVMDEVGQAGLVSSIDNHFWRAVPAVLIQGVLRGSQQAISGANPWASGMAGSAAQYGVKITQPYIDMRPTILVEPGEACTAILTKALELPEYKEKR